MLILANRQGCGLFTRRGTYGADFNANGGGVWATQISSDAVRVWFWPRENITGDVLDGVPNPELWGKPEVEFKSSDKCSVSNHWRKQTIVSAYTGIPALQRRFANGVAPR